MGGVMRLVQRRLGVLGWEHLVAGEARMGVGVGVGVGMGIGLRQGRLFGSSSSALSVSTPCWSRSRSVSLSLSTASSTSSLSWSSSLGLSSRDRSGIRRYVIFCCISTCVSLSCQPLHHHHHHRNTSYARFSPRLFPPIAGIGLLHNDASQSHPLPCSPIPRSHALLLLSPIIFLASHFCPTTQFDAEMPRTTAAQCGPKVAQMFWLWTKA
ncbi:hypothetical protein J3F84DRAFT_74476 [Trichoderma pleuroticola]